MACKTTCSTIDPRIAMTTCDLRKGYNRRLRRRGMTLIELMAAVGIGAIVILAVALLTVFAAKSFAALRNYDSLDRYSRNALDKMSHDIRQTRALATYQTNKLIFTDYDGASDLTYY